MKKSIILIHENKEEWDVFKNALAEMKGDFTCEYASHAGEALKLLQNQKTDFLFIDHLQSVQGFQLLSVIKANARLRHIKVFIYSENIGDDVEKMARTLGASGCIEKPWTLSRLTHQFRAIFAGDLMPDYAFMPRM